MLLSFWMFLLFSIFSGGGNAFKHDYYWRDYRFGDIPCDAFEGAPERYIGIADHYGNWVLSIYPYSKLATLASDKKHIILVTVQIMCTANAHKFYWEYIVPNKTNNSQLMENAVIGGRRSDQGLDLYIGKAYHEDEWKIGPVVSNDHSLKGLRIWKQNFEAVQLQEFYLLKYNSTKTPCSCSVEAN